MKAFVVSRYGKDDSVRAVDLPSLKCGTQTYWSRSTLPASIPWILRSEMPDAAGRL